MSLEHYFPGEKHDPSIDEAVRLLLGDKPPPWHLLKPKVQEALLLLRRTTGQEDLQEKIASLKEQLADIRERSFTKEED